jgi:hypothetical protein
MPRSDGLIRTPDGDLIEPTEDSPAHPLACDRGWLGENAQGHVIPCPVCRPHLVERLRSTSTTATRGQHP